MSSLRLPKRRSLPPSVEPRSDPARGRSGAMTLPRFSLPKWMRLGPASRVAAGLVGVMLMLLLVSDVLFRGFLSDRDEQARRERRLATQALVSDVVLGLQVHGVREVPQVLRAAARRTGLARSVALVTRDGQRYEVGPHRQSWLLGDGASSTVDNIRTSLDVAGEPWGELQVSFDPVSPKGLLAQLRQPVVQGIAMMATLGFVAFMLFLRRAMVYLDPSQVVPDRVRSALDTLTEGVLIVDPRETVLLANTAFHALRGGGPDVVGQPITQLQWLVDAVGRLDAPVPWRSALGDNRPVLGQRIRFSVGGKERHAVLNCSPINEGGRSARGCLVTMTDVTELQEHTDRLHEAMRQLEDSREQIRRKNEELELLATRDPLTGCLNRRALASESAALFAAAAQSGLPVSCIMCDIDHFKRVNDTFGHAGGDVVLQAAAKALGRTLRSGDLLARLGGEEFCLLLAGTTLAEAREVAERLRAEVEANVGRSLRGHVGVRVTMSFGIEQVGPTAPTLDAVIDLADRALYHSKRSGRNQVSVFAELAGT